ncbi:hypothetical protein EGW08_008535 [Elysia chlorotica]|uniref:Uncharacterized protein n=1 Tax=Elysia chlorotica TaxID=188477 RepID=A0A433TQ61_ELYCH|nr:hypothetical protein EGW08_008535 [Elysia chlorotica]
MSTSATAPGAPLFEPRVRYGQGKTAMTILTEGGYTYPVIHEPYSHRAYYGRRTRAQPGGETSQTSQTSQRSEAPPSGRVRRGDRPMHQSTLTIAKPPWEPDFTTTSKHYFSGSHDLDPVRRPPLCPSMHTSQIQFGSSREEGGSHFCSDHMMTYQPKDIIPANRLHLTSLVNRVNQTEGAKVKEVVRPSDLPSSNWSQYTRIHTKLGVLRGPGVAREFPVRQGYNILTGEETGPAWKSENSRVSGNRVLHSMRGQLKDSPLLF